MYKHVHKPTPTDNDGFINMMNKISMTNSKLMFLTARTKNYDKTTQKQFNDINILSYDYGIHYTEAKITKGEYIKQNINIEEWDEVIFIDDYLSYIQSVKTLFPQIKCYNFIINNNI